MRYLAFFLTISILISCCKNEQQKSDPKQLQLIERQLKMVRLTLGKLLSKAPFGLTADGKQINPFKRAASTFLVRLSQNNIPISQLLGEKIYKRDSYAQAVDMAQDSHIAQGFAGVKKARFMARKGFNQFMILPGNSGRVIDV